MSETTNLKLFKHDNPPTNENQFDVENALNKNWDKIDESYGEIKENILTLQENDTEIKEDIEEIQENISNIQDKNIEQDNKLTDLEQENKNIKNALINVETEQAKSLHIEDASTVAGVLEVEGNAEQETQEGTDNLAILENKTYTQNGVRVEIENGVISISGNATANTNVKIGTAYLKAGKTYYIEKTGTSSGAGFYINFSGTQHWFASSDESNFVAETTGEWEIRINTNSGQAPTATDLKLRISEQTGAEWVEGKVQIPSPINPSKIKCLGSNKNYFNKDTVTQDKYLTYQNQEVSNSAWTFSDYIECKPNEQWIISGYTAIGGAPSRCFYDANKNHLSGGAHNNQESMMKFTIPDNCYYFRDSIAKADIDTVKIEKGDTATSYSPYRTR